MRRSISAAAAAALASLFLLFGTTTSHAVAPLTSLDGLITDQDGSLGDTAALAEAQANFHQATGADFYVVFIDSFDGMDPETWATTTATNAGLTANDILLVVSPGDESYWLQHGDGVSFTSDQENNLVSVLSNSLNAGLTGTATWADATANIVGAFQNELDVTTTPPVVEPAPDQTVDSEPLLTATAEPAPEAATGGGMPTWLRVSLIVLGVLAALFALWLLLGRFNEKRLAKREQNPFNFS